MKTKIENGGPTELNELSISEILEGILVFLNENRDENRSFSDQDIYRFFGKLEAEEPALSGRFAVKGVPPHQRSEPLRQTLSFFAMGKILEVPQPNPVRQYYRARPSQLPSVRKNLEERGVLASHSKLLEELATKFRQSISVPATEKQE